MLPLNWPSLVTQLVKICLQCGRPGFDPWVGKISLEKGKVTHSTLLAWRIPWTSQRVGHTEWLSLSLSIKLAGKWATAPHDPLALISDNEKWRQIFQSGSVLPQLLFLSPLFFNVWSGDFSLTFFFNSQWLLFFIYLFFAIPLGMWDPSSPIRDWTHTPCPGSTGSVVF